jgi:hypothetical protein
VASHHFPQYYVAATHGCSVNIATLQQIAQKLNIKVSRRLSLYITAASQNLPLNLLRKVNKRKTPKYCSAVYIATSRH